MTVLYTGVPGFTAISEGLKPKALSTLMNAFLTPLTQVIFRGRCTIDSRLRLAYAVMGDAVSLASVSNANKGIWG